MIDTEERRRPTEHARQYVASTFTPRTIGSLVLAIALFVVALLLVALTAGHVEPHFALYSAGLTFGACGFVMLIGCGASSGHGGVAMCTAAELERRGRQVDRRLEKLQEEVDERFDEVLANQRKMTSAFMGNELARRRGHN